MELSELEKEIYKARAHSLKGSDRRVFMGRIVNVLGKGGQRRAERELGWDRASIAKGQHELGSGIRCVDGYAARGGKRAEVHLLVDIAAIVDGQSQTDPSFESTR